MLCLSGFELYSRWVALKYSSDLNLGQGLCICTSFHSQILDFIY